VYKRDSLVIRKDNRQVKNVIYVRGGEYLGDTLTATYISDGQQNVVPLTYKYDPNDIQVFVTGTQWNLGQEPTETPEVYDLLWNNEARLIRFHRAEKLPSNGSDMNVIGKPYLPVIVKVKDSYAVEWCQSVEGGTGEHEYLIVDKSIITKEAARERARAELLAYARSISDGEFVSYTHGFKAGQKIRVNSSNLGIDEYFVINKVSIKMFTPTTPMYSISLVSTRTFGIIDFLNKLLNKDRITVDINPNEITDTVESVDDELSLTETVELSTSHNAMSDSLTLTEVVTVQTLNYGIKFVYGPQTPSGVNRIFILNGSRLA
jgi:hypothetical protein